MIPMIRECYDVCKFLLENRGFDKAYKWYTSRESEARRAAELYTVFDFYGIPYSEWKNMELLYEYTFTREEHIDVICKYLALEWIQYERDRFIYKASANVSNQAASRKIQGQTSTNTGWRP